MALIDGSLNRNCFRSWTPNAVRGGEIDVGLSNRRELTLKQVAGGVVDRLAYRSLRYPGGLHLLCRLFHFGVGAALFLVFSSLVIGLSGAEVIPRVT